VKLQNYSWFTTTSLITCLIINSLVFAEVGEIEKRLFQDGAKWRGEDYVRTRQSLVEKGKAIIPFLEQKTKSPDSREKLFAKILISRINNPEMVQTWHKNLMSPIYNQYDISKTVRTYNRKIDWHRLPKEAVDVPASHLVDVLWEYDKPDSTDHKEATAVTLQFYLAPDMEALDAVIEIIPSEYKLVYLTGNAVVKLGSPAVPRMRQVLVRTVKMRPSAPQYSQKLTKQQRKEWDKYRRQKYRACIAAYVLSRLNDRESIPLIAKCLADETTDYTYSEELSADLAHMKAVEAVDSMLDITITAAVNRHEGSDVRPGYFSLRSHVKSLGPEILPALRNRLNAAQEEAEKIVLNSLITELSSTIGKDKEVAQLRESFWFNRTTEALLKLHKLTGEDIFPELSRLMLGHRKRPEKSVDEMERTAACLAFGTLKETRAIPLLTEGIRNQHEFLELNLNKRQAHKDAAPFDPQKAREAGYTFGQEKEIAKILAWGDTCLLALRRIGGNEAKQAIATASQYPEYKTRGEISLLLMEGKTDEILKHLQSENRAFREEAALALLELQDKRATYELLCAAARRQGPSYEKWKNYARSSRKDISPVMNELAKSTNVREQVLAEAMLIEQQSSEKAEKCRRLLQEAARRAARKRVISIGDVISAGREVATKIEESFIPLVEEVCVFGHGVFQRGVAAFALAEFKKTRSMYVLAESFNMGSVGGGNPAALALAEYGDKGAELAAKAPPPTPGQYNTGRRMTRHRAAVQLLAEQEDIRGVDEILKGLDTLKKDKSLDMWDHRMRIYLSAAEKFHDQRLVEPLLHILTTDEMLEHHPKVIHLLSAYDDDRLVPLFMEKLATPELKLYKPNRTEQIEKDPRGGRIYKEALTALTRRLGQNTPEYLIEQFNESKNDKIRAAALLALGDLSLPFNPNESWSVKCFNDKKDREKAAAKVRKLAYPVLVEALKDSSADVNHMAALGLAILATGNLYASIAPDLRAVEPLTEWCRRENRCFYIAADYLGNHGNKQTGQVLLAILKSQPPTKGNSQIVYALEKLKPKGTVPILLRNVEAIAPTFKLGYDRLPELQALAKFGPEGAKALLTIFNSTDKLPVKIESARLLGQVRSKQAVDAIAAFLLNLIAEGPENPKLIPRGNEDSKDAYIRSCGIVLEALFRLDRQQAETHAENILLNGPEDLKHIALKIWSDIKQGK